MERPVVIADHIQDCWRCNKKILPGMPVYRISKAFLMFNLMPETWKEHVDCNAESVAKRAWRSPTGPEAAVDCDRCGGVFPGNPLAYHSSNRWCECEQPCEGG